MINNFIDPKGEIAEKKESGQREVVKVSRGEKWGQWWSSFNLHSFYRPAGGKKSEWMDPDEKRNFLVGS